MKKLIFILGLLGSTLYAQDFVISPETFLGYPLGSQFTRHHKIVDYFKEVELSSSKVELVPYGETMEGRPLILAFISSPENLARKEEIRKNNLRAVGFEEGKPEGARIPIIWLSYNIHGNEASSSEAAMKTIYELVTNDSANWLKDALVIMDPCVNPDGRDRYVNWFRQVSGSSVNPNREGWEHAEPWPGGRPNHYLFDLNRDWCWQTQVESQQRAQMYHNWMPQVHVDYHEQGVNSPYYFGPAAEPYHEVITDWQREFQELAGMNHASYFDKNGWLYFTREIFDLFYPSYGDTWPTFQGAIGFTYEQAGHGTAGLAIKKQNGDTLTLEDRLTHHFVTGLSTIEISCKKKDELISNFDQYFEQARNKPDGTYKSYIISHKTPQDKLNSFLKLMDQNAIKYGHPKASNKKMEGFSYQSHDREDFSVSEKDILIPLKQSQANLVKVLLEPSSKLEDSLTYDLTAWSLLYAYDLEAYATEEVLSIQKGYEISYEGNQPRGPEPYGYALSWQDMGSAKFLARALKNGFQARYTSVSTKIGEAELEEGSLVFLKADNWGKSMTGLIDLLEINQKLTPINSGFSNTGKDLGSETFELIDWKNIAVVGGTGTNSYSFGEVWYFFEQQLGYPITVIPANRLRQSRLSSYDVLILTSGNYRSNASKLKSYVEGGGRIIALERAMSVFATSGDKPLIPTKLSATLKGIKNEEGFGDELQPYGQRERSSISNFTAGSIYSLKLDKTHPLTFGLGDQLHIIKRNSRAFPYIKGGFQIGIIEDGKPISGFTGASLQDELGDSFVWGAERMGRGEIIYFADSPIFRGFWYTGQLAFANSIFFW
ncbi:MAG: M14 family metallopeptidase [Bacteroidia bacterium]|nr:M14 family metallopeptidase [Bacteroidia bacterium]